MIEISNGLETCLAYGRLFANDRSLQTIDRIFVIKRPYVFFKQPDEYLKDP